ncbi:MAG TPA: hypothetical protein VMS89_06120 [Methanoregulaceae archaeon]|nr:hypothetical protein [Methanoregulaceae archaeon]
MEKTEKVLIAIVIAVAVVAVVFILMNGFGITPVKNSSPNATFKAEAVVRTKDVVFSYIPPALLPGSYSAAYEFRKNNVTQIQDRHTFTEVSPENPIQIGFPNTGNGTYTVYMLINDQNQNPVHKSISVLVLGNNTTFSSASFLDAKNTGNPFSSPIPVL